MEDKKFNILKTMYDAHNDKFISNFHTTLWQVLINDTFKNKVVIFVLDYNEHGLILGVATANEKGYTPTPTYFKKDIKYDEAKKIIDIMNNCIFGLDERSTMVIELSTF